jgi:hypothetical protein
MIGKPNVGRLAMLTGAWQLVALHHTGDPDFAPAHKPEYNKGIEMTATIALLAKHRLSEVIGPQELQENM